MKPSVIVPATLGLALLLFAPRAQAQEFTLCAAGTGDGCQSGEVCVWRDRIDPAVGVCAEAPGWGVWLCSTQDSEACIHNGHQHICRSLSDSSPIGFCDPAECPDGPHNEPPENCVPPPLGDDDVGIDPCAQSGPTDDPSQPAEEVEDDDPIGPSSAGCSVGTSSGAGSLLLVAAAALIARRRRRR